MPGVHLLNPAYLASDPTFVVHTGAVAMAANKFFFSIFNGNANNIIQIQKIKVLNRQTAAVTGVFCEMQLKRGGALTGGVALTPVLTNTTKTLPSGITIVTNTTSVTAEETNPIDKITLTTEEISPTATSKVATSNAGLQELFPMLVYPYPMEPPTLNQNQSISMKQITSTTVGTYELAIYFTTRAL